MSGLNEAIAEQVEKREEETTGQQTSVKSIFEEIEEMTPAGCVNVLIQAANLAVSTGELSLRDSVMIAKAISILRPGSI